LLKYKKNNIDGVVNYYYLREFVDMRKGFDALCGVEKLENKPQGYKQKKRLSYRRQSLFFV